jgi:rhodanese-related sulfurtransferase
MIKTGFPLKADRYTKILDMKRHFLPVYPLLMILIILFPGCSGNKTSNNQASTTVAAAAKAASVSIGNETGLLLKDLKENGDYVNSQVFPSLIKASIVHENLGKNILVIDLRSPKLFSEGHIKGAVNKRFEDLPGYFETGIKPFEYDKIIMVCDDGQISSYTTCLLRLKGYGNVFSMRWGMSAWNEKYAREAWLKGVSGKHESDLETRVNEKPAATGMPELATGRSSGEEIESARFSKIFGEGTGNIMITADEVFANPSKYFIINLERKDKYEDGHIPGAVRFKPEGTLGYTEEMSTIPSDKTVVVYCGTGHNSGFATAYLRLFGYDARTLKYGNNSFMYDKMLKEKISLSWLPFSEADVNNFETVR